MPPEKQGSNTKRLYLLPVCNQTPHSFHIKVFSTAAVPRWPHIFLLFCPICLCSVCAAALFLIMSSKNWATQVMETSKVPLSSLSSAKINAADYWLCLFHSADNVLLSEDGRDTFLCDFGHAERLDSQGQSLSGSKGKYCKTFHLRRWVIYPLQYLN